MNKDFVDLVHETVGLLGAKLFHHHGKAFHIAEHNGNLPVFALDFVFLTQNLFSEACGKIALNLL